MAKDLFVLLLALEMEDQDLIAASCLHYLSANHGALAGPELAFFVGDRQHIVELDGVALVGRLLLDLHYVSGSDSILLPPGANHRVHNSLRLSLQALGQKGLNKLEHCVSAMGLLEPCATQAGTETTGKPCNFNVIDAKRSTYRPILVRAQFDFTNSILPLSASIVPAILLPLTVTSHLSNATVRPGWGDVLIVRVL